MTPVPGHFTRTEQCSYLSRIPNLGQSTSKQLHDRHQFYTLVHSDNRAKDCWRSITYKVTYSEDNHVLHDDVFTRRQDMAIEALPFSPSCHYAVWDVIKFSSSKCRRQKGQALIENQKEFVMVCRSVSVMTQKFPLSLEQASILTEIV